MRKPSASLYHLANPSTSLVGDGDVVQEAGRAGVAAAALGTVGVDGLETGLGHELLNVAEEASWGGRRGR